MKKNEKKSKNINSNRVFKFLFSNLILKGVSFIFAITIFIVIHLSLSEKIIKTIKITPSLTVPSGFLLTSELPEISIIIQAPKNLVKNLSKEDLTLNLSTEKSNQFLITKKMFPQLKDTKIIQILPEKINVIVEKIIKKSVPIVLNKTNQLPKGYSYQTPPKLEFNTVSITGPQSYINSIDKLYTEPLDQNKIVGTTFKLLNYKFVDQFIEIENKKPIKVSFEVKEQLVKKEFKKLPIIFINCEMKKFNIEPMKEEIDLFVEFPYSLSNKLKRKDFYVYADLKGCNKFKSITNVQLITTSFYNKVLIKYSNPDSVILKRKFPIREIKTK